MLSLSSHLSVKAPVILGSVTIFGVLSYVLTPEEKWLPRDKIMQAMHAADGSGNSSEEDIPGGNVLVRSV